MLKMIHGDPEKKEVRAWLEEAEKKKTDDFEVSFDRALFPAPFASRLEYNSPAHGPWNIVHTGMLIPGAHQIYVCAANCCRGVVLTAAEMEASDRFSSVEVKEEDIYSGEMEDLVIEGVADILEKLPVRPTAVLLFTVCLHHFMGCDLSYIYDTLRSRFPDQYFVDCYMDCINQKEGLTPDQKLRISMYSLLEPGKIRQGQVSVLGGDLPMIPENEAYKMIRKNGGTVKDITETDCFEEYLSLGESPLMLCFYPPGKPGAEITAQKTGARLLYMPMPYVYEQIDRQLSELAAALGLSSKEEEALFDLEEKKRNCDRALEKTAAAIREAGMEVVLDISAVPHVLGLARLLLEHGFPVSRIYADAFFPEEKEHFDWIRDHAPGIRICSVIHPAMRLYHNTSDRRVLAVGQKAAYFHQTPHFVNMVEGGGLYGYAGILALCRDMEKALREEKDTADLVVRKGLGCACCL